jgi:hypothetical protein
LNVYPFNLFIWISLFYFILFSTWKSSFPSIYPWGSIQCTTHSYAIISFNARSYFMVRFFQEPSNMNVSTRTNNSYNARANLSIYSSILIAFLQLLFNKLINHSFFFSVIDMFLDKLQVQQYWNINFSKNWVIKKKYYSGVINLLHSSDSRKKKI